MAAKLTKAEVLYRQRTKTGILLKEEVARIKWLLEQGMSKRQLKEAYNVSLWTIRAIARGDTWHWVESDNGPDVDEPQQEQMTPGMAEAARLSAERFRAMQPASPLARLVNDIAQERSQTQSTQDDLDTLKGDSHHEDNDRNDSA